MLGFPCTYLSGTLAMIINMVLFYLINVGLSNFVEDYEVNIGVSLATGFGMFGFLMILINLNNGNIINLRQMVKKEHEMWQVIRAIGQPLALIS